MEYDNMPLEMTGYASFMSQMVEREYISLSIQILDRADKRA